VELVRGSLGRFGGIVQRIFGERWCNCEEELCGVLMDL